MIKAETVGFGFLVVIVSVLARCMTVFFAMHFKKYTLKERLFMAFAWSPKAVV